MDKQLEKELLERREERKRQLEEELKEIRDQEKLEQDERDKQHLISILDNGDLLLSFIRHSRISCIEDGTSNEGRCGKCNLQVVVDQWKRERQWLVDCDYDNIKTYLGHYDIIVRVDVS